VFSGVFPHRAPRCSVSQWRERRVVTGKVPKLARTQLDLHMSAGEQTPDRGGARESKGSEDAEDDDATWVSAHLMPRCLVMIGATSGKSSVNKQDSQTIRDTLLEWEGDKIQHVMVVHELPMSCKMRSFILGVVQKCGVERVSFLMWDTFWIDSRTHSEMTMNILLTPSETDAVKRAWKILKRPGTPGGDALRGSAEEREAVRLPQMDAMDCVSVLLGAAPGDHVFCVSPSHTTMFDCQMRLVVDPPPS
jgi:hypothetical protein